MAAAGLFPVVRRRTERKFKRRVNELDDMSDTEILSRYRLSRDAISALADTVREELERKTRRSCSIPVLTQVLVGLRFLAKGDFLSEVADLHGISRSSACNIIDNFIRAVNAKLDNIRFPDGQALNHIKHKFYQRCRNPNTVGAVDCTLVPILALAENEQIYVCRKNYHALNVQAVVDHTARFTDAVAKWPGSTHDSTIFENSGIKKHLEENNIGHVLGDSGYPLKKYLLTPLLRPATEAERAYNNAQSVGRIVVERAFGLLKSRFRCLHKTGGCLTLKPEKSCRVILACMRLHNMCIELGVPAPEPLDLIQDGAAGNGNNMGQEAGAAAYRQSVIRLFEN